MKLMDRYCTIVGPTIDTHVAGNKFSFWRGEVEMSTSRDWPDNVTSSPPMGVLAGPPVAITQEPRGAYRTLRLLVSFFCFFVFSSNFSVTTCTM